MTGKDFNGKIVADDPKIKFDFLGEASFAETPPSFNFGAELHHVDLYNLHLLDMDTLMHLTTDIDVNFSGLSLDELVGSISINNTHYQDSRGSYQMDSFNLVTTHYGLYPRSLTIESDFIDLEIGGEIDFANMGVAFKQYVGKYLKYKYLETETTPSFSRICLLMYILKIRKHSADCSCLPSSSPQMHDSVGFLPTATTFLIPLSGQSNWLLQM